MSTNLRDIKNAFMSYYQDKHKNNNNRVMVDKFEIGLSNLLSYYFSRNVQILKIKVDDSKVSSFLEAISSDRLASKYNVVELQSVPGEYTVYAIQEVSVTL